MAMKQGTALLLKGLLLLSLVVGLIGVASADTKYNPMSGEWEQTSSNARLEYDAMNGSWGYVTVTDPAPCPAPTYQIPASPDPVADIVKSAAPNNNSGTK
jgi:hypothetical protein